ncbi:hypothetical protein [Falsiphaeobacter marinintestinus]|uniref:hypothetical protein n=1 Tax=Falsiphaeobacter marinintestinus TaxID=1492905 RepID=UPI001C989D3E|nr:hypothetical protein [Phaeobacter marinintestinus]
MLLLDKLEILTEMPDDASRLRFLETLQAHFDAEFYLDKYPDVLAAGLDPMGHYVRSGWREGREPNPEFSTRSYLDANPDVAEAGVNPFLHYVSMICSNTDVTASSDETGPVVETSDPLEVSPSSADASPEAPVSAAGALSGDVLLNDDMAEEIERIRSAFDAKFYLFKNPGVAEAGGDPVEHYARFGWKEGRDPSPDFSTRAYLEANPDVAEAGVNPLLHYVLMVWSPDEATTPSEAEEPMLASVAHEAPASVDMDISAEAAQDDNMIAEIDRIRSAFDTEFYLFKNPGVAEAGGDPVEHYARFGWKEGRDPSPEFSTLYYLQANPDVAATGRNPFLHYVVNGQKEGRRGKADG